MENVSLIHRGIHSGAPKASISFVGDDIELSYNLTTFMEQTENEWSANNATVTYGRSFSYGNLPESTETVTTINYPFLSVYYQMNNMPVWLSTW